MHLFAEKQPQIHNTLQRNELQFLHRILLLQRYDPRFALQHGFAIVQRKSSENAAPLSEGEELRLHTANQSAEVKIASVTSEGLFPNLDAECEQQRAWLESLYEKNKDE